MESAYPLKSYFQSFQPENFKTYLRRIPSRNFNTKKKALLNTQGRNDDLLITCFFFLQKKDVGLLFGFYGISTFVGYLTPNPFLCK